MKEEKFIMPYLFLAAAIVLEVTATTLLEYSEGFTKPIPTCASIIIYTICFYALSKALNHISLGIAYATWCSAGIVLTSIISVVIFGQKLNVWGIIGIVLIIIGCVLVNLFGSVVK